MQFHLIDGKMTCLESKKVAVKNNTKINLSSIKEVKGNTKQTVITWNIPTEPTVKVKRNIMEVPMMPVMNYQNKSMGYFAKSSMLAGLTSVALMNASAGSSTIIWDAFINYVYPWFLQVAKVFCIIKIAQTMYQNHGSGNSMRSGETTNFGAMLTWGKWYAIFLFLPFVVELIEGASQDMLRQLKSR